MTKDTIPCRLCLTPTPSLGTKLCDACWELEHRIHGDPELANAIIYEMQEDEDKFTSPKPLPSPFEAELIVCLIEECAEVQHRASKLLRFGAAEIQPGQDLTNTERLSNEIGDVFGVLEFIHERTELLSRTAQADAQKSKWMKLYKYLQHLPVRLMEDLSR